MCQTCKYKNTCIQIQHIREGLWWMPQVLKRILHLKQTEKGWKKISGIKFWRIYFFFDNFLAPLKADVLPIKKTCFFKHPVKKSAKNQFCRKKCFVCARGQFHLQRQSLISSHIKIYMYTISQKGLNLQENNVLFAQKGGTISRQSQHVCTALKVPLNYKW